MVLCTDGCVVSVEILLNKLKPHSTGIKFTKEYSTSNTVHAFLSTPGETQ